MLGDASNGEMGEIPEAAGVVRTIMQEAERCNAALGIQLDPARLELRDHLQGDAAVAETGGALMQSIHNPSK